jgi:glucose-1-phosphate adenylyltransferase
MGSVPFGARYRLIDFTLSNMVNSGINEIGVVTKSNYQSLLDHLGSGAEWDMARKNGGLHILPPFGHAGGGIYRGRLEALHGVLDYLTDSKAEYVFLSDCDVVTNMDLRPVLNTHIENKADITVVYGKKNYDEKGYSTRTVFGVSDLGRVYDVLIRPKLSGEYNSGLNMFIIGRKLLLEIIGESAARNLYSWEADVIQKRRDELQIYGYKYDGYYSQINSIIEYRDANMALMDKTVRDELFYRTRPIYTKIRDDAPAKYGLDAAASNSLVADGCIIDGKVYDSILFRGVKIGKDAVLKNCVIMQDSDIGEKVELENVIADKDVVIGGYRTLSGAEQYPAFIAKGARV